MREMSVVFHIVETKSWTKRAVGEESVRKLDEKNRGKDGDNGDAAMEEFSRRKKKKKEKRREKYVFVVRAEGGQLAEGRKRGS